MTNKINIKRFLKPCLLLVVSLALLTSCTVAAIMIVSSLIDVDSKYYSAKIASKFNNSDLVPFGDIFEFEFAKAYVLADDFLSGAELMELYNLDCSIEAVAAEESDLVGRIVFVDENNNFVFDFTYMKQDMFFEKTGLIIYPDTLLKRNSDKGAGSLVVADSTQYYFRSISPKRIDNALIERAALDQPITAYDMFNVGAMDFKKATVFKAPFPEYDDKISFYDEDGILLYEYLYDAERLSFSAEDDTFYPQDVIKVVLNEDGVTYNVIITK